VGHFPTVWGKTAGEHERFALRDFRRRAKKAARRFFTGQPPKRRINVLWN
jgi:hypothetical protein